MASTAESVCVDADVADQRGGSEQTDARYFCKSSTRFAVAVPLTDLGFDGADLSLELTNVIEHIHKQLPQHSWQSVGCVFGQRGDVGQVRDTLRQNQAVLTKQAAQMIADLGSHLDQ